MERTGNWEPLLSRCILQSFLQEPEKYYGGPNKGGMKHLAVIREEIGKSSLWPQKEALLSSNNLQNSISKSVEPDHTFKTNVNLLYFKAVCLCVGLGEAEEVPYCRAERIPLF